MVADIDEHIAKRLRLRRRLAGLTLQNLAALSGIRMQQIHKYETAGNRISAAKLWRLAQALGVDASYFFEGLNITTRDARASGCANCREREE